MAPATITKKQQQVLTLLSKNKRPGEVAKTMGITRSGVYRHMSEMRKLGIDVPSVRAANQGNGGKPAPSRQSASTNGSLASDDPVLLSIAENITLQKDELGAVTHDIETAEQRLQELGVRKTQTLARIEGYERARTALSHA